MTGDANELVVGSKLGTNDLTESVAGRIESILATAQDAAAGIRDTAAAATSRLIAEAQEAVERDSDRIKRDVEARAAQYLAECHRRVDAFADARVKRLRELADALIERTDALQARFDETLEVERQLESLIEALGNAADQIAREVRRPEISLPTMAQFSGEQRSRLRAAAPIASTEAAARDADQGPSDERERG
jgi:vacuolar-type H+-ATPase subunit I/STV1